MRYQIRKFTQQSLLFLCALSLTGCSNMASDFWEGMKTAIRSFNNQASSFLGKDTQSRLVASNHEFFGQAEDDYIPLNDQDIRAQFVDYAAPQPKEVPGGPNSKIPGIKSFVTPPKTLATLFKKIYFNSDKYVPKSNEEVQGIIRIATYLKKHPETYVFIEGHCDQRASEAYNLSLGTKRSNYVRSLLIKHGVNPGQLFTISYGKEKLEDVRNNEAAWAKNRRVSFKIYEKRPAS